MRAGPGSCLLLASSLLDHLPVLKCLLDSGCVAGHAEGRARPEYGTRAPPTGGCINFRFNVPLGHSHCCGATLRFHRCGGVWTGRWGSTLIGAWDRVSAEGALGTSDRWQRTPGTVSRRGVFRATNRPTRWGSDRLSRKSRSDRSNPAQQRFACHALDEESPFCRGDAAYTKNDDRRDRHAGLGVAVRAELLSGTIAPMTERRIVVDRDSRIRLLCRVNHGRSALRGGLRGHSPT